MPGFPSPSSGGFPESRPGGSAKPGMPGKAAYGGQSGGQVMISGPEEKALRVLELDNPDDPNDDTQLLQQASVESGMPVDRVMKLKARAEAARNKGMTLKGPTITLQPINPQVEDGLMGPADPMADVAGQPPGAAPGVQTPAGAAGPAGGAPKAPLNATTMASAGLSTQRFAPSWRPQMSQATAAPPRMTPDVNSVGAKPVVGAPTGPTKRGAGFPRPVPAKAGMSGGGAARFGQSNARDPRLAAAYARESRVEECRDCGGTCKGKKKHRS